MKTFNILTLAVILSAAVATYAISEEQGGAVVVEATEQVVAEGMEAMDMGEDMMAEEATNEVMNEVMDDADEAVEAVEAGEAVEAVAADAVAK